jgi:AAA ATPase domain
MLCGRDAERARIGELIAATRRSQSGALVVRGEPGIGKTALLEDTRERADDMHVLTACGVESESELPFAALHQLVHSALRYVERIPEPQAKALRGALGLAETESTERFLVSAACLSLLSELSERRPVLCLVDDAHWLDNATADALLFVARRLEAEGILMVFATREGDVRSFEATGIPSLLVGALDAESSATLLERGAGLDVDVTVIDRLVEQTNGNALALLEVPAALTPAQLAGTEPLPEALPLTRRVEEIFLERVRRLPEDTQRLLLVAAADDSEQLGLVLAAAAELGVDERELDVAERSGLLEVYGTRLEFRHPLVRSAVYDAATSGERRAAHQALAAALDDAGEHADRRAWHLASSVLDADEAIAQTIEAVAERAQERGGYASAARAFERASEVSADPGARTRRLVRAARAASTAGADELAVVLAKQVEPETSEQRADVALVVGLAELRRGRSIDIAPMLIETAREVADVHPGKAIELLVYALSAASTAGNDALLFEASAVAADVIPPAEDEKATIVQTFVRGFGADRDGDQARAVSVLRPAIELAAVAQDSYAVLLGSIAALVIGDDRGYETLLNRAISMDVPAASSGPSPSPSRSGPHSSRRCSASKKPRSPPTKLCSSTGRFGRSTTC